MMFLFIISGSYTHRDYIINNILRSENLKKWEVQRIQENYAVILSIIVEICPFYFHL